MVSKAQKIRLGIFLLFGFSLTIVFMALVAGNKLIERRDYYYISYEDTSVSGLEVGGQVKYHGIRIGRVDEIQIDKEDIRRIIVKVSLEAGTPIKEDVRANLAPVGITGLMQIELSGGTNQAKLLKPDSKIQAGTSTFESISGKAEVIAKKLEVVLSNLANITNVQNRKKLANTLENLDNIIENVDNAIENNQQSITKIVANLDSTSYHLTQLAESAGKTMEELKLMINSKELKNSLNNFSEFSDKLAKADIGKLIEELNAVITSANNTFTHVDLTVLKGRKDVLTTLETLKETIDYLNEFSRQISEEPSIILRTKKR